MRRTALFAATAAMSFCHLAQADTTITTETRTVMSAGAKPLVTTSIEYSKGSLVREDNDVAGLRTTKITDIASGTVTTLDHAQKAYHAEPGNGPLTARKPASKGKGKCTDTGQKEKIGSFTAKIFSCKSPSMEARIWLTQEVSDNLKKASANIDLVSRSDDDEDMFDASALMSAGYVFLKGEYASAKMKTTMSVSISEAPLSNDVFKAPAGYKKLD